MASALGERVAWVEGYQGRVVLLRLEPLDGQPLVLSGQAADVWRVLQEVGDREQTIATLASAYAVDPVSLSVDVHQLLDQLVELGVIDVDPQTQRP